LSVYAFIFYGLGDYSLKEPDEGRYAEIPREMVKAGTIRPAAQRRSVL
jgi:4-amino-4-deoxy-L-arabinose transferase-like glycosyltransferase